MIENWRNALSKAADISGFELEACNGDEGELVDKVVEQVLKKVKKPALALDVAKYPTGLDDKMKLFENSVLLPQQRSGKPQIYGIVGLGGVGKTTLAKEFFNRNSSGYQRSCFLSDVRDNADRGSLNLLQKILLKNLTGTDNSVNSVDQAIGMLKKHLSSANALVIIDDVDHVDQVYALWPHQTVLHSKSLILITSRNKDILISSGVEESSIYNLTGLSTQHSLELFCLHSFSRSYPPSEFESLVNTFLESCAGLPLSLKVIGAHLHGKDTSYWGDELNKLGRILPNEIKQSLQISYDALGREEQQIFLDIACFFIGEDKDMAVRIWDNGLCGFRNIQDRCLVEVNSEKKIKMHGHLRDLGREIAKASGLPRRLWRWTENDIDDLLQQSCVSASSVTALRGIKMALRENGIPMAPTLWSALLDDHLLDDVRLRRLQFVDDLLSGTRMMRLQLLDSEDVLVERILTKIQYPNLIWLRWKNCPCTSLPPSISLKNLRVLQLQCSKLQTLWEEESQAPVQLRELEIQGPLSNIGSSIGKLKHLERILIYPVSVWPEKVNLTKLPEEFCLLQSLRVLILERCSEMKSLPECFGNLTNLQQIRLSHCSALENLPASFCKLIKLQSLDLQYCTNVTMSSQTLGNICTLEYMNLTGRGKIEILPPQVARQRSLEQLYLRISNLKELPSAIGELSALEVLVVEAPLLDLLPPSLCDLKNLKELHLSECKELKCLPASLGNLKELKELQLYDCRELKYLPASLGDLQNLKKLIIHSCKELKCLPGSIGMLTQLTALRVRHCPLISELPFKEVVKGKGETLNDLDFSIDNCILPRLQVLTIERTKISEISFAGGVCVNLEELRVLNCRNVVEVGILPNNLISLALVGCRNLRKIDKIHGLAKLQQLLIWYSIELEELPNIETLVSLWCLDTRACAKLRKIGGLGQLQKLWVTECYELEEVEGIQHCMSLKSLHAEECPKLQWSADVVEQLRQRCSKWFVYR
eukprot:PITA_30457